jgi:hypothetical protein
MKYVWMSSQMNGTNFNRKTCGEYVIYDGGPQFFLKNVNSHLKILDARRLSWNKFQIVDPRTLGTAVQNLVLLPRLGHGRCNKTPSYFKFLRWQSNTVSRATYCLRATGWTGLLYYTRNWERSTSSHFIWTLFNFFINLLVILCNKFSEVAEVIWNEVVVVNYEWWAARAEERKSRSLI